jgi:hypothetical protein
MSPELDSPAKRRRLNDIKLALESCATSQPVYSSSPVRRGGSGAMNLICGFISMKLTSTQRYCRVNYHLGTMQGLEALAV